MCDCKNDIESKLLDRFKNYAPDAKSHEVRLAGYTIIITDGGLVLKGCMPIELSADRPLKKGGFKHKKETQQMIFSYCPFCGRKYGKEAA